MFKLKNKALFFTALILCLLPFVGPATALFLGLLISFTVENPFYKYTSQLSAKILSYSVAGLGAGIHLDKIIQTGKEGFILTLTSISITFLFGLIIGRLLKTDTEVSVLVTTGTAICGGSAIAAAAPAIQAKNENVTIAMALVFILNAIALVVFPEIGHLLNLSQNQFGIWAALAIHDTSSVVGATLKFGAEALEVGTTVKLTRALWIIPITLILNFAFNKKSENKTIKKPWFILWFLLIAAFFTYFQDLKFVAQIIEQVSKKGLVISLFLIGSNLNKQTLKSVGYKPLLQITTLWILVSIGSLYIIKLFY